MTLMDAILVMLVVIELSVTLGSSVFQNPFLIDQFKSDYLHTQVLAMAYTQTVELPPRWGLNVRFNAHGNINEPVVVSIGTHDLTLRLGTGRFDHARSFDD